MNIIPAIDICGGRVVHGSGGDRERYEPIQSELVAGDKPADVAMAMLEATKSKWLYVADIGAYQGRSRDWQSLRTLGATCAIADAGLLIDCGIVDSIDALSAFELLDQSLGADYKLIIALESMQEMSELAIITAAFGPRTAFSLDLRHGEVCAADDAHVERSPAAIAQAVTELGIEELIVLDTSDVGGGTGCSSVDLCRQIRSTHADVRLLGGGGVRDRFDVQTLISAGCDAVLVATALHQKRL